MAEGCCRERDNNGRVVVAQDFQQSEIRLAELHWSAEERRADADKEENSQRVSKRREGGREGGRKGGRNALPVRHETSLEAPTHSTSEAVPLRHRAASLPFVELLLGRKQCPCTFLNAMMSVSGMARERLRAMSSALSRAGSPYSLNTPKLT